MHNEGSQLSAPEATVRDDIAHASDGVVNSRGNGAEGDVAEEQWGEKVQGVVVEGAGSDAATGTASHGITPDESTTSALNDQNTDATNALTVPADADVDEVVDEWPARQPLPKALPDVPPMTPDLIPDALRDWIADAAERLQVPMEMVAVPAIVGAGAVIGRAIAILPSRLGDWWEVPNLWGAVVGRPGVMKSPAAEVGMWHVRRLAHEESCRYQQAVADVQVERDEIQMEIERAKRGGAKDSGDPKLAAQLVRALRERDAALIPVERRYITQDATVEKLGELLLTNHRGILVLRDELHGWLAALDKPGREGDREFYLEAWSGRNTYTTDRIARGTLRIPALVLSIFGTIQPSKLQQYVAAAVSQGTGDDGLLQRFQLLVWPDVPQHWKLVDRGPLTEARDRAARAFDGLAALTAEAVGASTAQCSVPALRFAPDAQELFDHWRRTLEHRVRGIELESIPAYESHVSKYRSLMPSLALVYHLLDVADGRDEPGPVTLKAARRAVATIEFLDAHTRRVYGIELDRSRAAGLMLAQKIKTGHVVYEMPVRDIRRAEWSGLDTQDLVEVALGYLAKLGWARVISKTKPGGKPERVVLLHPDLLRGLQ